MSIWEQLLIQKKIKYMYIKYKFLHLYNRLSCYEDATVRDTTSIKTQLAIKFLDKIKRCRLSRKRETTKCHGANIYYRQWLTISWLHQMRRESVFQGYTCASYAHVLFLFDFGMEIDRKLIETAMVRLTRYEIHSGRIQWIGQMVEAAFDVAPLPK